MDNTNQERKFQGIWFPAELWLCESLSLHEKAIFLEIQSLSKNDKGCYASNEHFQRFIGRGETTISQAISKLKKLELIEESEFDGRKRFLKIQKSAFWKIKKLPFRNLKTHIYRDKHRDKHLDKVSKDTMETEVSDDTVFKSKFVKKIVCHWNSIGYTSNIKTEKTSKTIDKIDEYLRQLRQGTFLQKNTLSPLCRRKNNIPDNKQYSREDILMGINRLALFFKGEYEPADKTCLPKGLLSLIYNPMGKTSWLMQAIHNHPKLISDKIKVKDSHPKATEFFLRNMNGNGFLPLTSYKNKLIYGVRSMEEFRKRIPPKTLNVPKLNREFGDLLNLCKNYWDWLDHQNWVKEIIPTNINTRSRLWKMFVKEMEDEDCEGYKLQ